MVLALRVVVGITGAESTVLRPLIAVDFVVLVRVDMRGGGVAHGWQRCHENDDEQRSEWSSGHRASSGIGGMIENNAPATFMGNVNA